MPIYPLDRFATVVLDGSGNGVASLGPARVREKWQPFSTAVSASTSVKNATCVLFYGPSLATSTRVANTVTGSTGDNCGTPGLELPQGYSLFAQWTGGDPGATATMHTIGTYSIGTQ